MLNVIICQDKENWSPATVVSGALNPDAVALVELLDPHAAGYSPTMVKVTLTFGRELYLALNGGHCTSDLDERRVAYQRFVTELRQAKSPLAAL